MVKTRWSRLIFILILMLIWETLARFGHYNPLLFPSLQSIASAFVEDVLNGRLVEAVYYSLFIIGKGLILAFFIAITLVLLSRSHEICDDIVALVVTIAHPLPGIAILPLVILWFGIGERAVLFVVVHSMLWPIVITLKAGVLVIHQKYDRLSKAFSMRWSKRMVHLYGMGLIPSIITGAKIGWSRGWRAFISSEMVFGIVGEHSGLGWYLFEQRVYFNSPKMFAALLTIVLCGLFMEQFVFEKAENYILRRWH